MFFIINKRYEEHLKLDYINFIIIRLYSLIMGLFGHLGLGFAIKRFTPQIPLWVLLISTMFIDILAMTFFIFAPLWTTHGFFMAVVWSFIVTIVAAFMFKYLNKKKNQKKSMDIFNTSTVIGLLVFSHWVIDLIGWSMTGSGIPLLFNDSQLLLLNIQIDLIIGLLIIEIGPMIIGLVIYIHYIRHLKRS